MLMNRASSQKVVLPIVLIFMLVESYALADPLQNGDFSGDLGPPDDFKGWDYSAVSRSGEVAVMWEEQSWPWQGWLEQKFTIPDLALSLSFEYKPLFENNPDAWDSFTVLLWDSSTSLPIVPAASIDFSDVYFAHDWYGTYGIVTSEPDYVELTPLGDEWTRVTLDLPTSLWGSTTEGLLAFDFLSLDNTYESQILVDNVSVAVVPVFSSVLLGAMGLGTAATILRRKNSLQTKDQK